MPYYALFDQWNGDIVCLVSILILLFMGFVGCPLWLWTLYGATLLYGSGASELTWQLFAVIAAVINIPFLRVCITGPIFYVMKALNILPAISDTEKVAIEAGTVWIDGELFSGKPDFKRLMHEAYPKLSRAEKAFLDGPVEKVCQMVDDWDINTKRDLPENVWKFLKKEKFFGMIIAKKYGGLGFSGLGHSAVIAKLSARSSALGITVMVPNSLGPGELLQHYGTKAQKDHYLPRLAKGLEMPCFALTEPLAGSDAGAMSAYGDVIKKKDGKLYLKLNWDKRYITLAAISSILGLAFKLRDPNNYLGKGEDVGITCALIPTSTKGVTLGRRHDPLSVPFYNCPTTGKDVEVPIDAIIGGPKGAGNGWRMLMESLAAGRGISLPATSTGGAKLVARIVGAYSTIRQQFGLSIGKFEGIQEAMAEIGGLTYMLEGARIYTAGGIDGGAKPPVVTAMAKYNFTEMYRTIINHGMDILGGAAISRGPRNLLAHPYMGTPVGITVEGANILTRTLMVFGQGAIRCHPYARQEIEAIENNDVMAFDKAFTGHIGHVARNGLRALLLSITRGKLATGHGSCYVRCYQKKLAWASASFAFFADVAMGTQGGDLKRREMLTGRFADILSWLYLLTATLKRYEAEGRRKEDRIFVDWNMQYGLKHMQDAFDGIFANMAWWTRPLLWWSRLNPLCKGPSDALNIKIANAMQEPGAQRDRLTDGLFISKDPKDALTRYENALNAIHSTKPLYDKVKKAMRKKVITKGSVASAIDEAVEKHVISKKEASLLHEAEALRLDAIQVDSFTLKEYLK